MNQISDAAGAGPAVSVLIAAYNAAPFLGETIESVLAQTFRDFELVIVDDGSTDDTVAIAEAYAAHDARLRIFARPHEGVSQATNFGLSMCRAELVARLDADDLSMPDRLEKQVPWMIGHPNIAALGGGTFDLQPDGRLDTPKYPPTTPAEVRQALRYGNVIAHPTVILRRSVVLEIGGYRSAFVLAEDFDLWLRLVERSEMANLPDILAHYRRHPGQVSISYRQPQMAMAELAMVAAAWREQGKPDPFNHLSKIDGAMVRGLGLPKVQERRIVALLESRWRPPSVPVAFTRRAIGWARRRLPWR